MNKYKLKAILNESIDKVIAESVGSNVPWFIQQFRDEFGVYFDNTECEKDENIGNFKVQFLGRPMYRGTDYAFKRIRVVWLQSRGTWADDIEPAGAYQMVYSMHAEGYLPSKKTKSKSKIEISQKLLDEYTSQCNALGIEILHPNDRKYSKAPRALQY